MSVLGLVAAASSAVLLVVDRDGIGGLFFIAVTLVNVCILTAGPMLRGARPLRIWIPQMVGGLFLLLSMTGDFTTSGIGPLAFLDLMYFGGYAGAIVWLIMLTREVAGHYDRMAVLDSIAVVTGVTLALWETVLAPSLGADEMHTAFVWAAYPIVDALVLALCGHAAARIREIVPSMRWLLGALSLLLILHIVSALGVMFTPVIPSDVVTACDAFVYYALAMSALDPSVVDITRRPEPHQGRPRARRSSVLVMLALAPLVFSPLIPRYGTLDMTMRAALGTVLLVIVFSRLSMSMAALLEAEAGSQYRATHDRLTGLLNRAALFDALGELLARNAGNASLTAVLFVDCDDFKHINDTWGHHAGDNVLMHVARRMSHRLGPKVVAARHGGDEFVIASLVGSAHEAVELGKQVRALFEEPVEILPGRTHGITPSIGIALAGAGRPGTAEDLIRDADAAMYEAKKRGRRGTVVFDEQLAERTRRRASVAAVLGQAIDEEAFELVLQPIMAGPGYHRLAGWEALARWDHPDLGEVSPGLFIPIAEQHGLIDRLGKLLLNRACREFAELRRLLPSPSLFMSVNVSPLQLLQPDLPDIVREARLAAGLPEGCLWLEITETVLIDQGPVVWESLERFRQAGVSICIDDFGTGYASLNRLLQLPVECVKLDKSLVGMLGEQADGPQLLGAVIDLVRSLGIERIVAEGVENVTQATMLRDLGCPMAQGWLYGRPNSAADIITAITTPRRRLVPYA